MRILFVTGSLVHGGAERHSITLMNRLAERGHECHAVYIKDDPAQRDRIVLRGEATLRCLNADSYLDRRAVTDFADHLEVIRPDLIVAANAHALVYATLARRRAGLRVPLLATFHSTRLLGWKEQLKMLVERFFFLAADCLVFVCENQRRYWRRRLVFARRNEVIHNGVDTTRYSLPAFRDAGEAVRRQHRFSDNDYVIGMVAVLRQEKNPLQLLDAVATLRQLGIPATALFVGDGPMREAIEIRAWHLGIAEFVAITGLQQDVRPFLAACNVVAVCSTTEAFSLAALEAMAMSRPVIHSEVGGAAEMIETGHNGYLFPVGDTRSLVYALRLLADRQRAQREGRNARRVIEHHFSELAMLDRYEEILLSLCSRPTARQGITEGHAIALAGRHVHTSVKEQSP